MTAGALCRTARDTTGSHGRRQKTEHGQRAGWSVLSHGRRHARCIPAFVRFLWKGNFALPNRKRRGLRTGHAAAKFGHPAQIFTWFLAEKLAELRRRRFGNEAEVIAAEEENDQKCICIWTDPGPIVICGLKATTSLRSK